MALLIRLFSIIVIVAFARVCLAHDANMATFQIRQTAEQEWMYEVMTPLYNLDRSARAINKTLSPADIKSIQYKQEIIAYIKQGFDVKVSGYDAKKAAVNAAGLTLGRGRIKLDDHLSVLIFKIKGMPETVKEIDFQITNMSEYLKHNNLFRIIKGNKNKHYLLNKENNFSGKVTTFLSKE
jgi:hypothetical protein